MDNALRKKLIALCREHDAFHQRQRDASERSDALIHQPTKAGTL